MNTSLSARREILFIYDIKMGNPNGDPDENRPRRLPDGTFYVTDVRLKRFVRDYVALQGKPILVGNIEGRTSNLTGRVAHHLNAINRKEANGRELVDILLNDFVDARWFGSSLAFKEAPGFKLEPEPKTLTGAVQFNMGEVIHKAEEINIQGTAIFSSDESKKQGTFTSYAALRYGLIAFNGVANEHSAKLSRMTDDDYELLLKAIWCGVRSSGNTRTKVGQVPRLLVSIEYNSGQEFQFGNLVDYVRARACGEKVETEWSSPEDYLLDLTKLQERFSTQNSRIKQIRYEISPDINLVGDRNAILKEWLPLNIDTPEI
ncbi:MAG: type I-B CRISPR-associated protein Cas7/Csh2 [Acidobacteria bacterium]|nr:type I-B CRISPR-associated protein Cas7/Csh2 [Acidobacteriota bacterium]